MLGDRHAHAARLRQLTRGALAAWASLPAFERRFLPVQLTGFIAVLAMAAYSVGWLAVPIFVSVVALIAMSALASIAQDAPLGRAAWILRFLTQFVPLGFLLGPAVFVQSRAPSHDFYLIAAQVIPVLLLAVVIEARIVERIGSIHETSLRLVFMVILGMALGEYEALRAVWSGKDHGNSGWVIGAIAAPIAALILLSITPPLPPKNSADSPDSPHSSNAPSTGNRKPRISPPY